MKITELKPFGLQVTAPSANTDFRELASQQIRDWVALHRVVVFHDFALKSDDDMLTTCSELGEVLQWEFGAINELKVNRDAANYLYTNHAVPFHWDGAFVGRIPHFIFFHCIEAPDEDSGGETTFCNTVELLKATAEPERELWSRLNITYSTEKVVHYGGSFTSPLIASHPVSGEPVIRYAEPVADLNPVTLQIEGLSDDERATFCDRMQQRLYDPANLYDHAWRSGDIVIADNHALLHGQRAQYHTSVSRHLRRVNIL